MVAWGQNDYGQTMVPAGLTGVTAIAAGWEHSVALKGDGTVVAWGDNRWRQTTVPVGLTGVTAIAAGGSHTVALKRDGTVVVWGENYYGLTTAPAGLTGVKAISAGGSHSVALKEDGTVVAWGANSSGQATVPAGLTGVTAIAAGGSHTVALKEDGTVVAWGNNSEGQTMTPAGLIGVMAIAAGGFHTVALKRDGTVVAWGVNSSGQTSVPAGLTGVKAIIAGYSCTIALKNDGTLVGWGSSPTFPSSLSIYESTVLGAVSYNTVTLTSTFTPSMPLTLGVTYRGIVNIGVANSLGLHSATDTTWSFKVGAPLTISGTLMSGSQGLSGVTFSGADCTTTDGSGSYSCTVPFGWSGAITPSRARYQYIPDSLSYSDLTTSQTTQNFMAAGTLTVDIAGSGSVNSTPNDPLNGIACTPKCSSTQSVESTFTLNATSSTGFLFAGWSDACASCGTNLACPVTIDGIKNCIATFTQKRPVLLGSAYYLTIPNAYSTTAVNSEIKAQATSFVGGFTLDKDVAILLRGGFDADYHEQSGVTTIQGAVMILKGSLTVDRVTIR